MEEHKENANCIVKAFEEHPIFIFSEEIDDKKQYYFKANDIGKALDIVNIRVSIQNYDDDEVVVRKAYDQKGAEQDTKFLSSSGVYRLLFNSKKPAAKQFRKWASNILDDIIFNESKELQKKLKEKDEQLKIAKEKYIKDLEQKENEKNWLHNITKNQVTYKKYISKTDGVYLGSTTVEHKNYIEKIGKSVNVKKREEGFKTAGVKENSFHMHRNYELFDSMEYPTEKYIHSMLGPFRVNSERGSSEHFMIHRAIANKIIDKTISEQNETISIINTYIDLLVANDYNYDIIETILIEKNLEIKKITKVCSTCMQDLEICKFFLIDKKNNVYNEKCNTCITNYSDSLKEEIILNTLNGKKLCIDCKEVYNFDMFYVNKDNTKLLWDSCRKCHIEKEKNPTKQCVCCYEVFQYNNFRKSTSFKDGHTSKCKDCNSKETIKVICEFCKFQVLKQNLKNHQNSIACKESQNPTVIHNPIEQSNSAGTIFYKPPTDDVNETNKIEEKNTSVKDIVYDDETGEKKQCTKCDKILAIKNFYIQDPIKKTYRGHCISCHGIMSRELSKKIKENPIHGKKECNTCNNIYNNYLFFKDNSKDSLDGFLDTCIACYNKDVGDNCKHCSQCDKIKTIGNFASDKSKLGNRSSICKECKKTNEKARRAGPNAPKRKICDVCSKEVSPTGLSAHKRTLTCLAIAASIFEAPTTDENAN
jgi:prophage antirepressor-like protein